MATKEELLEEAKRLEIAGRSDMNKDELEEAVVNAGGTVADDSESSSSNGGAYAKRAEETVVDPEEAVDAGFFGTRPEGYADEAYTLQTGPASPPEPGESGGGNE